MRSDVKNRSDREAELYDKQRLQRDRFESALTYLNDGVGRLRRNEAIRAAMREATGSRVLEIGSQSSESCGARYGYRPVQLTCINIARTELEIGRAQAQNWAFLAISGRWTCMAGCGPGKKSRRQLCRVWRPWYPRRCRPPRSPTALPPNEAHPYRITRGSNALQKQPVA